MALATGSHIGPCEILAPLGAGACFYTMLGLPQTAWERFGIWLLLGVLVYVVYGYRRSRLRSRVNR